MLRTAAARVLPRITASARGGYVATSVVRPFAAAVARKPKIDDGSLEGRYATALFMAGAQNLDKVYADMTGLRSMMTESQEFKVMVETPGIDPESKMAAMEAIGKVGGMDAASLNFTKLLIENKRTMLLPKIIEVFEKFYQAEKGLVPCQVTSAAALTSAQKSAVESAMGKRIKAGEKLIFDYTVNSALIGGLVVKMGEAVYDQSVSSKLERIQNQLLAPVT